MESDLHVIIPCIDLQAGRAVQLIRGRKLRLAVEDVFGLLDRFRDYSLLHVIDLDAAMGRGSNARLVGQLCRRAPMRVRVGGGIRTAARAKRILAVGAEKVIIGSAAFRDGGVNRGFLSRLVAKVGRKRIIVAVDTQGGRILVRGWREKLSLTPDKVFSELESYASEFLCTYVDAEGTMRGTSLRWFRQLRKATGLPITAAGGIRSAREVRQLEQLGMNAAVGMALYLNRLR
ncbi:MAG: 1-(5-phosphoribosyl)-5-[(5-phosphoribosylamino)methylideneamino] imidazole-4-carboxamide isomerase [Acidobacteria bacterium]|nr:MAG: 1-(5-phosphoribosyl)-5-[(5-phosphoribosylamino)methylideneamino] imidazole-4-carboxamide isomerase [Acidobacteriota bacterium]